MREPPKSDVPMDACACCRGTSRRAFLRSSAQLALAGGLAAQAPLASARAQGAGSADDAALLRRLQSSRRVLLRGGIVMSLDRRVGDFAQADVLVEDGRIREIRPGITVGDDTAVVDAAGRIVMPGFVDTHSHSYQGLLRDIMPNGLLEPDYNRDVQRLLTPAYQAEDAYAGELVTALGMIDMGTTTVVDISQVSHSPEHSDGCIRALREAGIRAVFSYHRGAGPRAQYPQDITRLQKTYFSSKDQLLTLAFTTGLDAKLYAVAREAGVPAVLHLVGKDLSEPLLQLGRAGLLRPGDEYIHCLGLNDAAWRLMKDTGGHVSICAQIDMTMGHGTPTIQEALDHGFRPSLSSDHGVEITQDFFTVMRSTLTFQRWQLLQRARNAELGLPPLLTARDMLEFATIEGARCANLDGKTGTLTPGKDADIVLLSIDRMNLWPLNNAPGLVVNQMNPGDVDTVIIAGKVRKWRGSLVGVDLARVRRLVQEARDALMRRAGFAVNMFG